MRIAPRLSLLALSLAGLGCSDGPAGAEPTASAQDAADFRSESRAFRDWRVTCDNGNACFAFGPASEGIGWVRIAIDPGPDARPTVLAGFWSGDDQGEADPLTLVIDGVRFATIRAPDADASQGSIADQDVRRVIAAMAGGRAMSLSTSIRETGDAGQTIEASLSGATAALLWIDERQGRLGTTTALIRRGDRPASEVPAAPPLPVVSPAPAADQTGFSDAGQTLPAALEALPAVRACRSETSLNDWVQKEVMSARLDASTELWAVPCFAGAYNIGHEWFVTGPGGSNPRSVALPSANGETGGGTINGGYSPETRTLTAFSKGRGLGDCGTAQTWTWTGRAFVLTAETEMQDCQGIPADLWPTTWRTRER